MATSVEVVVAWRGGCPYRERAWRWIRDAYATAHPDWTVTQAVAPQGGPWIKALATNPAVEASEGDIIVQADADCWTDGLRHAVRAVEKGAGWAVPHRKVHRLSEEATAALISGQDWRLLPAPLSERNYVGMLGGGIVVARRGALGDAMLDPRFIGWGSEDEAQACALNALHGKAWRGTADLIHLWHPPQERETRRWGSRGSWALRKRYFDARYDPEAMRDVLEEARCPSPA